MGTAEGELGGCVDFQDTPVMEAAKPGGDTAGCEAGPAVVPAGICGSGPTLSN